MVTCIRLCLDCADICTATAGVISRQTEYHADVTRPLLEACVAICGNCADECERHARMHEHCRVCAEACRAASRPAGSSWTPSSSGPDIPAGAGTTGRHGAEAA